MFRMIGNFAVKNRIWFIVVWVLLAILMYLFAPSLNQVGSISESTFLPKDSESLRARELINQYFPESKSASTVSLIFCNPDGLKEHDIAYARQINDWLSSGDMPFKVTNVVSLFENPELETRLISPDRTTLIINAGLEKVAFESESWAIAKEIREHIKSAPEGLSVYVSGPVGIYSDLFDSINKSVHLTTLITIILIIVLLVIIYRSPVAAVVPLVTIGLAYIVSRGIMGILGGAGVPIWSQIDIFLIVMIFGIGTDYCLFLVARFREEKGRRDNRNEAMIFSVSRIGAVIAASAFAVIFGLAGMAVARYQMIQTMGPLLGVAIFITLLATLTFTPALASIFGNKLFWPFHNNTTRNRTTIRRSLWERVATVATGKPAIVAGIVVVLMLIPYIALPGLNRSFDQMAEIPANSESIAGYNVLKKHYDIGEIDPLTMIIVSPEGKTLTNSTALNDLSTICKDIDTVKGVVKVQSIVQPDGNTGTNSALTVSGQLEFIDKSITSSLTIFNGDTSLLFSKDFDKEFNKLNDYLNELEQNFAWVNQDPNYQKVKMSLKVVRQNIETIKTEAKVERQLINISQQIDQAEQALISSGFNSLSFSIDLLALIKTYLDELVKQYPATRNEKNYENLISTFEEIQSAIAQMPTMSLEKLQSSMTAIPSYLRKMKSDFYQLAQSFEGTDAVLYSDVLLQSEYSSLQINSLKSQFEAFNDNLLLLSNTFVQKGNPIFLSPTLIESSSQFQGLKKAFLSDSDNVTRLYIVLDSYPQSDAALSTVTEIRKTVQSSIENTSLRGSEVVIGGTSAELTDVRQILDNDFVHIIIVVLIAIFIVLVMLLRSLIAPVYLLLTVLLSYGTTLGIVTWIFQGIMGQDGVSFLIPILIFVLLISLGSDYNIFLLSRVREESEAQGTCIGVKQAAIATGGIITACGIILAGTFGALIITPIKTLMQIGVATSIGVLIDTFVVRALLVPAIASLLGRWNWWPAKRR